MHPGLQIAKKRKIFQNIIEFFNNYKVGLSPADKKYRSNQRKNAYYLGKNARQVSELLKRISTH